MLAGLGLRYSLFTQGDWYQQVVVSLLVRWPFSGSA